MPTESEEEATVSDSSTSLASDSSVCTVNSVFVCVECGQNFYTKAYLLHHSLVHKACRHCGNTSSHHQGKHFSNPTMSKQDAPLQNVFQVK